VTHPPFERRFWPVSAHSASPRVCNCLFARSLHASSSKSCEMKSS